MRVPDTPRAPARPLWLRAALAFGLVLVLGESLAALVAGVREPALYAWQAVLALTAGLALFVLPLSPGFLAGLALSAVGTFHAAYALHDVDARTSAVDVVWLGLTVLALGLVARTGLDARASPGRAAPRTMFLFGSAYLAQALWCAAFLFPNTDTSFGRVLPIAWASAVFAPAAALFALRRLAVRPRAPGALVTLALLIALPAWGREALMWPAHRIGEPPDQRPSEGPDVLLIVLDTVRADRMSLYGHGRSTTPALERFAAGATLFERAQSQGIWTLPGHASLFTGLYPSEHQADWKDGLDWCRPLRPEAVTLAERFGQAGYRTASIVSNPVLGRTFGLAQGFEWLTTQRTHSVFLWIPAVVMGIANFRNGPVARQALGTLERTSGAKASEINALALDWLERTAGAGPRFLLLNYMEAHDQLRLLPCAAPRFGEGRSFLPDNVPEARDVKAGKRRLEPAHATRLEDWYDSELACLDLHMGELFDELERRGLLDRMLVAVTSDHGHLLGEHEAFNHQAEVWRELTHVPLILKRPGQRASERVSEPVETSDLAFALPRLAGLDLGRPVPASLGIEVPEARRRAPSRLETSGPELADPASEPPISEAGERATLSRWNPRYRTRWTAIVDGRRKYFVNREGAVQVADDPGLGRETLRAPSEVELARARLLLAAWQQTLAEPLGPPAPADENPGNEHDEAYQERLRLLEQQGYAGH